MFVVDDAEDVGTSTICAFTGRRFVPVVEVRGVMLRVGCELVREFGVANEAACSHAFANSAGVRFFPRRNG